MPGRKIFLLGHLALNPRPCACWANTQPQSPAWKRVPRQRWALGELSGDFYEITGRKHSPSKLPHRGQAVNTFLTIGFHSKISVFLLWSEGKPQGLLKHPRSRWEEEAATYRDSDPWQLFLSTCHSIGPELWCSTLETFCCPLSLGACRNPSLNSWSGNRSDFCRVWNISKEH